MAHFRARIVRAIALSVASVCLVMTFVGCKKSHQRDGEDISEKPPIRATSADAQERFDEARTWLEEGQYDQAAQEFMLLQAEYADDPIAHVAELYAARAALGDLSPGRFAEDMSAPSGLPQARRRLDALADGESVDDRVAYAARIYLAASHSLSGDRDAIEDVLDTYPGPSLSSVLLEADRPLAFLLLGEAFRRADRHHDAVQAYAKLYAIYTDVRTPSQDDELGVDDTSKTEDDTDKTGAATEPFDDTDIEQLGAWADLSRAYGFRLSENELEEAALQDLLSTTSAYLRAMGGWGLLRRSLQEDVESDEARAALEDLFNRISPDLVRIDAAERAAELSSSLAAAGGPRRLAIGVVLPLSGSGSGVGARVMAGALAAVGAFNAVDEPSVTLVFQDSSQSANDVFERLKQQGVAAVVGPLDRKRAVEYAHAARQFELPIMTMTTQSPVELLGGEGDEREETGADEASNATRPFVFRNFIDPRAEARAAARLAFDEAGDRRAAIVYPSIGYGTTMADVFGDEFKSLGGQIVARIEYDRSRSDFASVAKRLSTSDAEAVFIPDSASKVAELTAFFANANIWGYPIDENPPARSERTHVHYLGTSLWQDPMLIRQARSYVEGAAVPSWFSASHSSGRVDRFVRQFEAVYERRPANFEAFTFDSVSWLVSLLRDRGMSRPTALRDALLNTPVFEGVTGRVRFDDDGEAVRKLRFVTPSEDDFAPLPFTARTDTAADDANESTPTAPADSEDLADPGGAGENAPE